MRNSCDLFKFIGVACIYNELIAFMLFIPHPSSQRYHQKPLKTPIDIYAHMMHINTYENNIKY